MTTKTKRRTPAQAIRDKCRECVGDSPSEIRNCTAKPYQCALHPYRLGKGNGRPSVKVIRAECIICMGGEQHSATYTAIKGCTSPECALWPYRLGKGYCTDPAGETWEGLKPPPANAFPSRK